MSTDLAEPQPIVSIPHTARSNDIRYAIMRMIAGRTREMRVLNAERVITSRSRNVTPEHRQLARAILDGAGDLLLQKGIV